MAGKAAIAGGIVMLILGIIITGAGYAITNQCNSVSGQLGAFLDGRNQVMCGVSGFGFIVGIFLGIIGFVLIIVGAVQAGTKKQKTLTRKSTLASDPNGGRSTSTITAKKSYCRHCGKEKQTEADFCSICGRSSLTNSTIMKRCQVCDALMSDDSRFCGNCGTEFDQAKDVVPNESNLESNSFGNTF